MTYLVISLLLVSTLFLDVSSCRCSTFLIDGWSFNIDLFVTSCKEYEFILIECYF